MDSSDVSAVRREESIDRFAKGSGNGGCGIDGAAFLISYNI